MCHCIECRYKDGCLMLVQLEKSFIYIQGDQGRAKLGRAKQKCVFAKRKFIPRVCKIFFRYLLSIDPVYSVLYDSVSGQQRPWSDCAYALADLGPRCPHIPEDTLLHSAAQIMHI